MQASFVIDSFPDSVCLYRDQYTIVAIDIIRATTTAVTALALGHRLFPFATVGDAKRFAIENPGVLLVGEQRGMLPEGFDLTNSPFQLAGTIKQPRMIALVSSSGTPLMCHAVGQMPVYVTCFRNLTATARHLVTHHRKIALIGAGSRREFRREDQMGCAYLGQKLVDAGYHAENARTARIVREWGGIAHREAAHGRSAGYLRRSGQVHDLEFILEHIDDLDLVPVMEKGELVACRTAPVVVRPDSEAFRQAEWVF